MKFIAEKETFISEDAFEKGMKPKFSDHKNDKRVAIIGSGPAGISAATFLLRKGFLHNQNAQVCSRILKVRLKYYRTF